MGKPTVLKALAIPLYPLGNANFAMIEGLLNITRLCRSEVDSQEQYV